MPTAVRSMWSVLAVLALALTVMVAIAIPTDTSASHDFNDVPDGMLFHDEVSTIKDAGITTGCGGGNFCPTDFVQRRAMAAFMVRGYGRVAMSDTLIQDTIHSSDEWVQIGEVTIDVPGAGASATQFVEVQGEVTVADSSLLEEPPSCYCFVAAYLEDDLADFSQVREEELFLLGSVQVSWVFEATPGPHTYEMWLAVAVSEPLVYDTVYLGGLVVTATTYPFGAGGGNVLSPAAVGDTVPLGAAALDDSRRPLGVELESSALKDALEGLRSKKP